MQNCSNGVKLTFHCLMEASDVTWVKQNVHHGMQRSRAWCGTPPFLGVVNMVGTRNFTCYMGAL